MRKLIAKHFIYKQKVKPEEIEIIDGKMYYYHIMLEERRYAIYANNCLTESMKQESELFSDLELIDG